MRKPTSSVDGLLMVVPCGRLPGARETLAFTHCDSGAEWAHRFRSSSEARARGDIADVLATRGRGATGEPPTIVENRVAA